MQGKDVVPLCECLLSRIPGHDGRSFGEVGYRAEQPATDFGWMGVLEKFGNFVQLADNRFPPQSAPELIVPFPEHSCHKFNLANLLISHTTRSTVAMIRRGITEPALHRFKKCRAEHDADNIFRCLASVHGEIPSRKLANDFSRIC